MKIRKKYSPVVTTHKLGKYILKKSKCPTPIYHGKGYKETKRNRTIKF